jgi:hypothetical protein
MGLRKNVLLNINKKKCQRDIQMTSKYIEGFVNNIKKKRTNKRTSEYIWTKAQVRNVIFLKFIVLNDFVKRYFKESARRRMKELQIVSSNISILTLCKVIFDIQHTDTRYRT